MDIKFDDIIVWEGREANGWKYVCRVDKIVGSNWVLEMLHDFSGTLKGYRTLYMPVDQSEGKVALWI